MIWLDDHQQEINNRQIYTIEHANQSSTLSFSVVRDEIY
jgi:hypothetical protein